MRLQVIELLSEQLEYWIDLPLNALFLLFFFLKLLMYMLIPYEEGYLFEIQI